MGIHKNHKHPYLEQQQQVRKQHKLRHQILEKYFIHLMDDAGGQNQKNSKPFLRIIELFLVKMENQNLN